MSDEDSPNQNRRDIALCKLHARRRVLLRCRQGLARRLRPDLVADRRQGADARRERVPIAVDDVVELAWRKAEPISSA
jgi:hypothetical protein